MVNVNKSNVTTPPVIIRDRLKVPNGKETDGSFHCDILHPTTDADLVGLFKYLKWATVEPIGANDNVETAIEKLDKKNDQQDDRMTAIEAKDREQDSRLTSIEAKDREQDGRLGNIETKNTQQDTRMSSIESKNTQQDAAISAAQNAANAAQRAADAAQDAADNAQDTADNAGDVTLKTTLGSGGFSAVFTSKSDPRRIIIQGVYGAPQGWVTLNWPITFPNAYVVIGVDASGQTPPSPIGIKNLTPSSVELYCDTNNCHVLAIGY